MKNKMDEDELRKLIGMRIAISRKAVGMSQDDLAAALEVDKMTISRWERGTRSPNGAKLYALTKKLGCSADFLLGLSDTLTIRK